MNYINVPVTRVTIITRLMSLRRPSSLSNSSNTARKENVSEKNSVAWHRPESCEHSSNHNAYFTMSLSNGWGNRHTYKRGNHVSLTLESDYKGNHDKQHCLAWKEKNGHGINCNNQFRAMLDLPQRVTLGSWFKTNIIPLYISTCGIQDTKRATQQHNRRWLTFPINTT